MPKGRGYMPKRKGLPKQKTNIKNPFKGERGKMPPVKKIKNPFKKKGR